MADTTRFVIFSTVSFSPSSNTASASIERVPLTLTWHSSPSAITEGDRTTSKAAVMSIRAPKHVFFI